jgi:DNA-binding transcriptional ArsR family regulator
MLAFVPVRFDLYRPLKAHLRWTLQCLVSFADRTGRCFPSVRKLAEVVGIGKSSVSRHLAQLAEADVIIRTRKPGGVYSYTIAARFLPAAREVSRSRSQAVPHLPTEEKPIKKTGEFQDDSVKWEPRLRAWRHSGGRFWNAFWGPKPSEPGCFVPTGLLNASTGSVVASART